MNQDDIIARLAAGEAFGGKAPERIDTHISVVFLAGTRAYKLKRALETSYLDYSTLDLRRKFCEAEIEINRRTAPQIYRRATPVTRETDGRIALGGDGETVEWVVEMARFEADRTFDRLLEEGALSGDIVHALADEIAAFHADAERIETADGAGIVEPILGVNEGELRAATDRPFAADAIVRLVAAQRDRLDAVRARLDARAKARFVRRCHGDLHLRNICLIDGAPVIFDSIEFNEDFIRIDVFYDFAFLLMDLARGGQADFASLAANRYLARTGDYDGLAALPLFQSLRATIRAHVTAKAANERADGEAQSRQRDEAQAYLDLAESLLASEAPCVVAVGGFSGTGKSTLARRLAPALGASPGAAILASDPIRKRLHGVPPEEALPESAYTDAVDRRVFDRLFADAAIALAAGFSVLLDMTFRDPALRQRAETLAREAGAPFLGFWLEGDPAALARRIAARRDDPSDATGAVLARQIEAGAGEIGWRRIDATASGDPFAGAADAVAAVRRGEGTRG